MLPRVRSTSKLNPVSAYLIFFTPYIESMDFTVCFTLWLQLELSVFYTGRRVSGFVGSFFWSRISSASNNITDSDGRQLSDITPDLNCFLVAGPLNCNYNLATT
jgi:hypothetical protein